ncbi:LysR family transcriptional regulator [Martelella alba]|nr:LysR family transcriptional regulator [Martelella alba]
MFNRNDLYVISDFYKGDRMNIIQLRCFVILSETLSFSHTAEILNLTQPAVTHQIKKLESELNFPLFNRNKYRVELTPAGKVFYPDAKDVLTRLQMAIDKASAMDNQVTDVINIGYEGHDLEKLNLPMMINAYRENHPSTMFMVFKADHIARKQALLTRKYDVILTVRDNIENTDNVIFKEIMSAGLDCVVGENHPLSQKSIIRLEDIHGENIILCDPLQCPKELNIGQEKLKESLPGCRFIYSDSEFSAAIMMKCAMGIAIMPTFCRQLSEGLVHIPFIIDKNIAYGVAYLKDCHNSDVPIFARMIKDLFIKTIR